MSLVSYVNPGFIKPQLATLKSKGTPHGAYLHETKYDGYCVQVHAIKVKDRPSPGTAMIG
jgi:ATP-dependent DNA ligase